MRSAVGLLASLMLATGLSAQWAQPGQPREQQQGRRTMGGQADIEGRVNAHGGDTGSLQVLLVDGSGGEPAVAQVSVNGSFSFSGVPYGQYELRLVDGGRTVSEQHISVDEIVERVDLSLPRDRRADKGDGTVSLAELQHRIPAQALKEAQKGETALGKGKTEEAIGHFERALEVDPDFAAVREGMANLYLQRHDDARAVPHLERLVKQRTSSVWAWTNLGAARFRLGSPAEAEAAARRALALDANQKINRYVLGISLASQGRNPDEALASLRATSDQFPRGHLVAARILAGRGDIAGARDELESYLGSNSPEDMREVKAWLARHPAPEATASAVAPGVR